MSSFDIVLNQAHIYRFLAICAMIYASYKYGKEKARASTVSYLL